jgi:hypothetical protein
MKKWAGILMVSMAMTFSMATSGCELLPKVLPVIADVITEIIDAQNKMKALDAGAQAWFKQYPNEAMQKKWSGAMDKAQAAIDVALKATHGAEDAAEQDIMGAMNNWVAAWQTLRELATSIGFMGANGTMNAGPSSGVVLDEPLAVKRSRGEP